jgi:flavin reductase (DIM6/NTAB) family NADH-FMN oxidoreductase RutF
MDKVDVPLGSFSRLLHPYNAVLITASSKDKKNVMAAAWIMPVSADPPILATSIRPSRYTYKLIDESGLFAVNVPSFEQAKEVLLCGRESGRNLDKFKKANFTVEKGKVFDLPIIKECVAHIECKVINVFELGDHMVIAGQVGAAYVKKEIFDNMYRLEKHSPLLHVGGDVFTTTEKHMSGMTTRDKRPKTQAVD